VMERDRERGDFRVNALSHWNYNGKSGAGDRGRTGDVQLGKLAFYH
jgi:hypothetical protein